MQYVCVCVLGGGGGIRAGADHMTPEDWTGGLPLLASMTLIQGE